MMSSLQLAKLTGSGFTVLPNRIIDTIIKSHSKYAADSLSLALYLVRHIPGQCGSLILSGEYSQASICEDLGWGITNRARLKRALADLEQAGIVTSELQTNNTVILHIRAEVDGGTNQALTSQALTSLKPPKPGAKDSLEGRVGVKKNSTPPPLKDYSQASRSSDTDINLNSEKLTPKNKELRQNKNHHHRIELVRSNQPCTPATPKDDDVDQLLRLYRSLFNNFYSQKIALKFAEIYCKNGRPFDLIDKSFRSMAAHPLLYAWTTSPNAVWELAFMQKKAASIDARIGQAIESLRSHSGTDEDCHKAIDGIIKAHNFNHNIFYSYYQDSIANLFELRSHDRAIKNSWQTEDQEFFAFANDDLLETTEIEPNKPTASESTAEIATDHEPNIIVDHALGEQIDTSLTQIVAASPRDFDPATFEQAIAHSQDSEPSDSKHFVLTSPLSISRTQPISNPLAAFAGDLKSARCKRDLIQIISKAYADEQCQNLRDQLETLINVAHVESISFDRLRSIMANHFGTQQLAA